MRREERTERLNVEVLCRRRR